MNVDDYINIPFYYFVESTSIVRKSVIQVKSRIKNDIVSPHICPLDVMLKAIPLFNNFIHANQEATNLENKTKTPTLT